MGNSSAIFAPAGRVVEVEPKPSAGYERGDEIDVGCVDSLDIRHASITGIDEKERNIGSRMPQCMNVGEVGVITPGSGGDGSWKRQEDDCLRCLGVTLDAFRLRWRYDDLAPMLRERVGSDLSVLRHLLRVLQ